MKNAECLQVPESSPLTLIHLFFQLNLKGGCCLFNPRVVQTSLEVPIFGLLNLSS